MKNKQNRPNQQISLVEAVETLSSIADINVDRNVGVSESREFLLQNKPISYKTIHWLKNKNRIESLDIIKGTFKVILDYLQNFYKKEYGQLHDPKTIEGIKTIMVLVGEAAQKLDKYTDLFNQASNESVTNLNEYKKLREFYFKKVARKIDEGKVGEYILKLTHHVFQPKGKIKKQKLKGKRFDLSRHAAIDLENVKKDQDYELLLIRREDGKRFYNPRLIRNIKLVCDFGEYFKEAPKNEPLKNVDLLRDRIYQIMAKQLIEKLQQPIERYYNHAFRQKERDIVGDLNQALFALYLCANPANLLRNGPIKCSTLYFYDLQYFLRRALLSRGYLKLVTYPPKKSNKSGCSIVEFIHSLCYELYSSINGMREAMDFTLGIIDQAYRLYPEKKNGLMEVTESRWWREIYNDRIVLKEAIKNHQHGPLFKLLNLLERGALLNFDSILQDNIPHRFGDLFFGEYKINVLRVPAPIKQEFINKAVVNEEFKGFLRQCGSERFKKRHLMVNLQDRTSWQDYARAKALEHLQTRNAFQGTLDVFTLPIDTDFYYQLDPYNDQNHADLFKEQFVEHILSEDSGFWFPESISKIMTEAFMEHVVNAVHQVFFSARNVLTRPERLNFIQIAYFFIIFKALDHLRPDSISFVCKDGIDSGPALTAQFFALIKIFANEELEQEEVDFIKSVLFAPSTLVRERVPHVEPFNRVIEAIKVAGNTRLEHGPKEFLDEMKTFFGSIYSLDVWDGHLSLSALRS